MSDTNIPPASPIAAVADNYYKNLQMEKEKKELRIRFEDAAFNIEYKDGIVSSTTGRTSSNSNLITTKEYNERIDILEKWDASKHASESEGVAYRKSHPIGYKLSKKFVVVPYTDGSKLIHALEKGSTNQPNNFELKIVVHQGMVFDIIYDAHHAVGHKKSATTHNRIKASYFNIPEKLVKLFIEKFCPTCNYDLPKQKPQLGCQKPIQSFQYRDRAQADLVDYRQDPQHLLPGNPKSPVMNWLLVIKDHLSRFVYARPLSKKEVDVVAFEISHHFSCTGYPLILHTDNGTEFGAEVLRKMKQINPEMICVRGRVRKPSDQGSVERSNQDIKKIIASCVHERREHCSSDEEKKQFAWTTEYQHGMRAMNCSFSRGTGNLEPYEIVFGQRYHAPMVASLKTRKDFLCPETLDDLRQYLSKELVVKYKGLGYFEDDDIPDVLHNTATLSDKKDSKLDTCLLEVASLANFVIQPANKKPAPNSARRSLEMSYPDEDDETSKAPNSTFKLSKVKPLPSLETSSVPGRSSKKRISTSKALAKRKKSRYSDDSSSGDDAISIASSNKEVNKNDDMCPFSPLTSSIDEPPSPLQKKPPRLADATDNNDTPCTPQPMRKKPHPPVGDATNNNDTPCTPPSMRKKPPPPVADATDNNDTPSSPPSMRKKPPPPVADATDNNDDTPSTPPSMRKKPPPPVADATDNNNDTPCNEDVLVKKEPVIMKTNKKVVDISISEAFAKHNSRYPYVCATLSCGICGHTSPFLLCAVFRKEKLQEYCQAVWLSTEFIMAFLILQCHETHLRRPSISARTILFHTRHHQEDDITTFRKFSSLAENIITYAHKNGHYSLLQFDLRNKEIIVHDGYQEGVQMWLGHAHYVLKKFKIVPVDSNVRRVISTTNSRDSYVMPKKQNDKWRMIFSGRFRQIDGHSCGPLCCATAWELFNGETLEEFSTMNHIGIRRRVIEQYQYLVDEFTKNRSLRFRKNPVYIDLAGTDHDHAEVLDCVTDDDVSLPESDILVCAEATKKRFKRSLLNPGTPPRMVTTEASYSTPEKPTSPGENEICHICLAPLKQSTSSRLVLPCSHSAHISCLRHWAEVSPSPTCPMCREGIPEDFVCFARAVSTKIVETMRMHKQLKNISDTRIAVTSEKAHTRMINETRARSRQQAQAKKMMMNASSHSTLAVGDIVTIEIPPNVRVRCSPLSPVGVVVLVSSHKTYAVAVPGGVLTDRTSTGSKTKWFSFNDLRKRDDDGARHLPQVLQEWRSSAMSTKFQLKRYPGISLQKAHGELIGAKHQGSHICKCNPSKGCTARCKCVSAGTLCHSSCKCNGKCAYTQKKTEES